MKADMSAAAVSERLREVARLADLRTEHRLDAKIDYSPEAVSRRLRQVEQLRRLCVRLAEAGRTRSPRSE